MAWGLATMLVCAANNKNGGDGGVGGGVSGGVGDSLGGYEFLPLSNSARIVNMESGVVHELAARTPRTPPSG